MMERIDLRVVDANTLRADTKYEFLLYSGKDGVDTVDINRVLINFMMLKLPMPLKTSKTECFTSDYYTGYGIRIDYFRTTTTADLSCEITVVGTLETLEKEEKR